MDVTYALDIPTIDAVRTIVADTDYEMGKTMAVVGDETAIEKRFRTPTVSTGEDRKGHVRSGHLDRKWPRARLR